MAQTVSITDKGNGRYEIKDSDGQTRIVDFAVATSEASKSGLKITTAGVSSIPSPVQSSNGYSYVFGQNYPTGNASNVPAGSVIINGKITSTTDAVTQAQGAKNLGVIRTNLIKYGQLTKAEARDPNNLLNKWATIVAGAANDPDPANRDPFKYAQSLQKQGFASTFGATTQPQPYSQITVWEPDKAKDVITQLYTQLVNREPTAEELSNLQTKLKTAQEKAASKTTYTKDKSGATIAKTTGGLDEQQFITDLIKATPDYAKVKAAGVESATQKIQEAARNNAIVLSDSDLVNYAERVRNGEPLSDITATFRKIAAISQPKNVAELLNSGVDLATIYQPYKSAMARTLEINPDTIQLNDPALTQAITGDKTMTSYEFQNSLRKDPRWQYTANAHDTVSNSVQQVLKDFGFMG